MVVCSLTRGCVVFAASLMASFRIVLRVTGGRPTLLLETVFSDRRGTMQEWPYASLPPFLLASFNTRLLVCLETNPLFRTFLCYPTAKADCSRWDDSKADNVSQPRNHSYCCALCLPRVSWTFTCSHCLLLYALKIVTSRQQADIVSGTSIFWTSLWHALYFNSIHCSRHSWRVRALHTCFFLVG